VSFCRLEILEKNPQSRIVGETQLLQTIRYYLVEWQDENIGQNKVEELARNAFSDSVLELGGSSELLEKIEFNYILQVGFLPGVTDNPGKAATEALQLSDPELSKAEVQVYSGHMFLFEKDVDVEQLKDHLYNPLLHRFDLKTKNEFISQSRFDEIKLPKVELNVDSQVQAFDLEVDDEKLNELNQENCWALSLEDMYTIRDFYLQPAQQRYRAEQGLPLMPTDVEIEILAQTWSEHCKHRLFGAEILYRDENGKEQFIDGLFKTFIKGSTDIIKKRYGIKWLVSIFSDNAGIVRFHKDCDLAIKVETHNSPSALDPYGGALTGILGVNRDILGVGLGAKPVANTNVFCVGPYNWPAKGEEQMLPKQLKRPKDILKGIHKGVEDGGNKSGVPTVNGAIVFHHNYTGKPLVYCGTVGILPAKLPDGSASSEKGTKPGDYVVMAGGRIGKDGIHGATFSSMELNEGAPAGVVQIGDPLTQKRVLDFLIVARDQHLFSGLTDNGAGGLSSSVGEMAELSGGAKIDVLLCPKKYPGLKAFELVISESQERMTFSVDPAKWPQFSELAKKYNVEVSHIGEFTNHGYFEILSGTETIGKLPLEFLHSGNPTYRLEAIHQGVRKNEFWDERLDSRTNLPDKWNEGDNLKALLLEVMSKDNIASKEKWVRSYDHEVQGATAIKPFMGKKQCSPSNSGVVWLGPHIGKETLEGFSVACGINSKLSRIDAYQMAQYAVDEAVRNLICQGTDPRNIALIDNFCWPDPVYGDNNPDGKHKLAQLVRANMGLHDIAIEYRMPFISGKDSMKNDFVGETHEGKKVKISVPPTLLVTALGKVNDVSKSPTSEFKNIGDLIYVIGKNKKGMGGTELNELYRLQESLEDSIPPIDLSENLKRYFKVHEAIEAGYVKSCHDISDGGTIAGLAEKAIGSEFGCHLDLYLASYDDNYLLEALFGEASGRFIISIDANKKNDFEAIFKSDAKQIGTVIEETTFTLNLNDKKLIECEVLELEKAWRESENVF
jgi:phosphoribosylformylglycinamidine synthase II